MDFKVKLDKDVWLEAIVLVVFTFCFLFFGLGTFLDHNINNQHIQKYGANDAFVYYSYSAYAKDTGQARTIGSYWLTEINSTEEYALFQPVLRIVGDSSLSYFTSLNTHDAIYVMLMFFLYITIMCFYLVIRRFNKHIALMSLAPSFLIFKFPFNISFYWGIWSFVSGIVFLAAIFLVLEKPKQQGSTLVLMILVAGLVYSYLKIFHFVFLFIGLVLLYRLYKKEVMFKEELVRWVIIIAGVALLSFYYFRILNVSYGLSSGGSFVFGYLNPANEHGIATPLFTSFGLMLEIIIILGLIIALFSKKNYANVLFIYLFVLCFSNYFLFGESVMKLRLFWPVYMIFFFGLLVLSAIVFSRKILPDLKRLDMDYLCFSLSIVFILLFAISFAFSMPNYVLAEPNHMQAYEWMKANTPKDSNMLYFYGAGFVQNSWLPSQRKSFLVYNEDGSTNIYNNNSIRFLKLAHYGDVDYKPLVVIKGLFSFEVSNNHTFANDDIFDICNFDYFVFGRYGQNQDGLNRNQEYLQNLMNHGNEVAYQNQAIVVIKNKFIGRDCINVTKA